METLQMLPEQLLETKFMLPTSTHALIARPFLMDLLTKSLCSQITLVAAPAGYGKTTLLTSWVRSFPAQKAATAWVSLDENDNDPVCFWTYVMASLDKQVPDRLDPVLQLLYTEEPHPLQQIILTLINVLVDCPQQLLLILDDYHQITDKRVHDSLQYFVEHLPPCLHLILATRDYPPFPLVRWQAYWQMHEIGGEQLRCTIEEIGTFFNDVMNITLSEESIQIVATKTEGWFVGLLLLGLSMQSHPESISLLDEISGSQRYIQDYLIEDVLLCQPGDIQKFLLKTSILDEITAPLCDAVLQQQGSQQMLKRLESANLYLVGLDHQRNRYRYHALFAEALRYRLEQMYSEELPELHRRAGVWYAEHHSLVKAILHVCKAADWQGAAWLIERIPFSFLGGIAEHEQAQLLPWLRQLPLDILQSHPRLCLVCAQIMHQSVPTPMLVGWLQIAEVTLRASLRQLSLTDDVEMDDMSEARRDQENMLGEVLAFQTFLQSFKQEDGQAVLSLCEQALSLLAPENLVPRSHVAFARYRTYRFILRCDLIAASTYGFQAQQLAQDADCHALSISYLGITVLALIEGGLLHKAEHLLQQAGLFERTLDEYMAPMTPEVGMLAICHADILREWNQLDDARDQALRGISMCQQGGSVLFALLGCAILMRVYLSRGELAEAGRTLEKFDAIGRNANPDIYHFVRSAYFSVDQVRFWLASDNLERALFWTHEVDEQADFVKPSMFDRVEVAYARVLLARQQPKLALQRLDPLLLRAVEEKRRDYVIEISLLQALAYQQQGNVHEAVGVLAHAVQLGEEEGYIRRFVDEGPRIKFLLTRLREQGGKQWDSWYIDTILTAFPQRSVEEIAVLPKPLVSLSVREIEVLRMLAQGVSNQDIAHELVVSINTVKRHVHNIFDKLEAANRTQAVIRARELSLF